MQNYEDWKEQSQSFSDIAVFYHRSGNLTGGAEPENIEYALVTPSFFRVSAVTPALGRTFREEENLPGRDRVAVLSYSLWQRTFGGEFDDAETRLRYYHSIIDAELRAGK